MTDKAQGESCTVQPSSSSCLSLLCDGKLTYSTCIKFWLYIGLIATSTTYCGTQPYL